MNPPKEKQEISKLPKLVKINAGGKEFLTYKSTLLKSDFLTMILEKEDMIVKIGDAIFIDENPSIFQTVLDALRHGYSTMHYNTESEKKYLEEKFEMYGANVKLQNIHPLSEEMDYFAHVVNQLSCSTRKLAEEVDDVSYKYIYKF